MPLYEPRACTGCGSTGHLRNVCPQYPCVYCRRDGHVVTDCPKTQLCETCNQKGHPSYKCRKRRPFPYPAANAARERISQQRIDFHMKNSRNQQNQDATRPAITSSWGDVRPSTEFLYDEKDTASTSSISDKYRGPILLHHL